MDKFCEYCRVGTHNHVCVCGVSHEACPFTRWCSSQFKWKPLSSMSTCRTRDTVNSQQHDGLYRVRFSKGSRLFVEVDDSVVEVYNPEANAPDWVDLVLGEDRYYIRGYEPQSVKQKSNRRKNVAKN